MLSALNKPQTDPTPLFESFRGSYGTELLTAAVAHFNIFGRLAKNSLSANELREELKLAERPAVVLFTALKAMGLLVEHEGQLRLTNLASEHLVPGGAFDVGDYVGLAANAPGVLEMVERLKTNRPTGADEGGTGAAFIYREGVASAMESEDLARHFTLALAGRAKNVAPMLAEAASLETSQVLLDVGGGTGIYSIACLQKHSHLRAIVLDRPEVLKVADEMAKAYGVADRLTLKAGDMFTDLESWQADPPDTILLSNILHDWDISECQRLVASCATLLPVGGRLLIHDVFLNDALDGPLPIALYSAALFTLTEGRAYSVAEYSRWLTDAGLTPQPVVPTLIHCGVLAGVKG
ncbi:MAG: methyltransferase [Gemmataceae bacterium]